MSKITLLRIRVVLVIAVVIAAFFLFYPPTQKVRLGLDLQGGTHLLLNCVDTPNAKVDNDAVNRALEIIRNRIDQLGVSEPVIQREGKRRILVQLPGIKNPEEAIDLIGKTALLEFKDESGKTLLTGAHLTKATTSYDRLGRPMVLVEFDKIGAKQFADATSKNVNKVIKITLDGKEISAPVVQEPILDGKAQISGGNFTLETAKRLAILLRAGALPVKIDIMENRTVGPTLGKDSIRRGILAGIIGTILVLLFMIIYYKAFGLIADVALIINLIILLGVLAGIRATLTLPGIAGIILTIGMAVDANVIIFERIKEELRSGKTLRASIDAGFSKAFKTILDANLTTLIAAFALFFFGAGPIRGFAVTLSLGILSSMFTAIVATKVILDLLTINAKSLAI